MNPDILLSGEMYLNRHDMTIEAPTHSAVFIFAIEAGTIIAMNIPYIAIPRADTSIAGSTFPATAPITVPSVQPK